MDLQSIKQKTFNRRKFLMISSVGVSGAITASPVKAAQTTDTDPTVVFDDQESDGSSVVVAEVATDVDTTLHITDEDRNLLATYRMEAGDELTDLTVDLNDPITESQDLRAFIVDTSEGDVESNGWVAIGEELGGRAGIEVTFIEADPDAGFNYPYYIWAPSKSTDSDPIPPLVEPVNTGMTSDDMYDHEHEGSHMMKDGLGKTIAHELKAPYIVPVFPRPEAEPVDWTHYVHALDDTTMAINGGPLERVDIQLLNMVADARDRLKENEYPTADGLMLNGFSASGNFVDRFAVLHPEEVTSVTAGGLNGMPLLPVKELDGEKLPFHVGIADVEELTGKPVDLEALNEVNQFLYMGAEDDNDTIPYDDAWTDDSLRQLALDVYGDDMVQERFPRSQEIYEKAGVQASFRIYEDAGHTPSPARADIIEFHRRSIEENDVSDMGETIMPIVAFDVRSADDGGIEFDASRSDGGPSDIIRYLWEFGDGETAFGETANHEFGESGQYDISLTIITDAGVEFDGQKVLDVDQNGDVEVVEDTTRDGAADDHDESDVETGDGANDGVEDDADETGTGADDGEDDTDEATTETVPGFGVTGAMAGIGVAVYFLKHRFGEKSDKK